MTPEPPAAAAPVLVGGVGQLYQGDFDLGRHAVAALARRRLGRGVVVEDMHYGAVAVAQLLQDLAPRALVLVGAVERGRAPGTVERRPVCADRSAEELQRSVGQAVTGYVDVDLVVDVALALGALPARTVAIEVEPVLTEPSEHLSPAVEALLDDVVELALEEARRAERDAGAPMPAGPDGRAAAGEAGGTEETCTRSDHATPSAPTTRARCAAPPSRATS